MHNFALNDLHPVFTRLTFTKWINGFKIFLQSKLKLKTMLIEQAFRHYKKMVVLIPFPQIRAVLGVNKENDNLIISGKLVKNKLTRKAI